MSSEQQERLKYQLNHHELLKIPGEKWNDPRYEALRLDFQDLLIRVMGYGDIFAVPGDISKEDNRTAKYERALWRSKMAFEPIAFTKALNTCREKYQEEKTAGGGFYGFFVTCYKHELTQKESRGSLDPERNQDYTGLSDGTRKLIGNIRKTWRQLEVVQSDLQGEELKNIIRAMVLETDDNPRTFETAWDFLRSGGKTVSLDQKSETEEGEGDSLENSLELSRESIEDQLFADKSDIQEISDHFSEFFAYLSRIASGFLTLSADENTDYKELYQYFLNNDLLKPLKKVRKTEAEKQEKEAWKQMLLSYEDAFWNYPFDPGYLEYVFNQPPCPDSVEHMELCTVSAEHGLKDKSSISYFNLTEGTALKVTNKGMYKKNYRKAMKQLMGAFIQRLRKGEI